MGTAEIDAVDIDADALVSRRLIAVGQHADAPHVHDQRAGTREEGRDLKRGNSAIAQVHQRCDVAGGQGVTAKHRYGDWGLLQILAALFRRNDDFFQLNAGGARVGGGRGGGVNLARAGGECGGRGEPDGATTDIW